MELSKDGKLALELVHKHMLGTRNDGKTPSWQHPLDVLAVVIEMFNADESKDEWFLDEFEQVALLHDIIEDTNITAADLRKLGFSLDVIRDVVFLTKSDSCKFGTAELVKYFYVLQESNSLVAQVVKCCDRISNLREAKNVFKPYRFARYQFETKMFLIPIAEKIGGTWGKWLGFELLALSFTEEELSNKSEKQQEDYKTKKRQELGSRFNPF